MTGSVDLPNSVHPSDSLLSDPTLPDATSDSTTFSQSTPNEDSPLESEGRVVEAELPFKTSEATPDLVNFLATQRGEALSTADPKPQDPNYRVSPADGDWSDFSLAPLEDTPLEEEKPSSWKTAWAVLREVGETIILTLIIFFLIQTVIRNFRVVGTSMVDNLHDGQYLIIDKFSYTPWVTSLFGFGGPQRGDVIVFEPPNRPGEDYVKRIIGLPGETVEVRAGQVFVNGQPLAEPFQPNRGSYTSGPVVVPEGHVFVLGDNRNNSNDSHNWGPLPLEKIVGRAWISYWPPGEWGVIPHDKPTEEGTLKYLWNELIPQANAGSE